MLPAGDARGAVAVARADLVERHRAVGGQLAQHRKVDLGPARGAHQFFPDGRRVVPGYPVLARALVDADLGEQVEDAKLVGDLRRRAALFLSVDPEGQRQLLLGLRQRPPLHLGRHHLVDVLLCIAGDAVGRTEAAKDGVQWCSEAAVRTLCSGGRLHLGKMQHHRVRFASGDRQRAVGRHDRQSDDGLVQHALHHIHLPHDCHTTHASILGRRARSSVRVDQRLLDATGFRSVESELSDDSAPEGLKSRTLQPFSLRIGHVLRSVRAVRPGARKPGHQVIHRGESYPQDFPDAFRPLPGRPQSLVRTAGAGSPDGRSANYLISNNFLAEKVLNY